ncbi:MAG: UDP-N-acetylmuramoyl-L-alanyl-D-glutamate--2,6-diaminopimelate ligase [Alphaproteobacteria bacterium]|nr:UDP-N-acetylmuramoyl-L-alanyl-D-glutamate--2,6-diaminopimelate ligase [Alphaproteobacteria bacterium]
MRLSELVGEGLRGGIADLEVVGLSADSREVRPGYLFAALPGAREHGARFLPEARARGAVAVLTDPAEAAAMRDIAVIADANPRRRFALVAARFFGRQPARVVAVTGTSGKTSVAEFARQLWTLAGRKAASLGTLGIVRPDGAAYGQLTTPDPVALHRALADLAADGIERLAMEASSHGLDQYRLDGVTLSAAAFTNLGRDHMDYHPSEAAYLAAKLRLFDELLPAGALALVNADDAHAPAVLSVCHRRGLRAMTYGRQGREFRILRARPLGHGQAVEVELLGRRAAFELPLIGEFQVSNALAAYGLVAAAEGEAPAPELLARLGGVPGRMQFAARHPSGAAIYVDYAHKPEALENVLRALRPHAAGRLVVVFGCGGNRDRGKRPLMGAIAGRLADRVIVTDDNPREEDPGAIRREILAAVPDAIEIGDRAAAIVEAIGALAEGDVLVIAGKGHENGQIIGKEVRPFNDAEAAREAVLRLARS